MTTTKKKTHQKPQAHHFLFLPSSQKEKPLRGFFASASSSLLVMRNLDQTIKIIYKTLALEETIARREQLLFSFLASITPSEEFTVCHFIWSQILRLTMFACPPTNWKQSWVEMMGAAWWVHYNMLFQQATSRAELQVLVLVFWSMIFPSTDWWKSGKHAASCCAAL